MNYKLAVIIPCWNSGGVIGDMLESIVGQSFDDWRVFCVDDKSTDKTSDVIQEYSLKDKRIVYVNRNRDPKGAQTCRNIGFELSEGAKYVIWFDCDDIIAPYCFEQRVLYMDQHPEIDFAVFKAKTFVNGLDYKEGGSLYGYVFWGKNDLSRFLRHTQPYAVWNNIYKRESVIKYGITWDENILSLQDSDFCIQSLLKGMKGQFSRDSRIDYFWRVNHSINSISKKITSDAHKASHIYYLNKLQSTFSKEQRQRYALEMDDYLFYFIDKFYYDKDFNKTILNQGWLKKRRWFIFRIKIYLSTKKCLKPLLFPIIGNYRRIYDIRCRVSRKLQMIRALKELTSD